MANMFFFVKTNGDCVCPSPPLLLPHSGYRLTNSKFSNFKITVVRAYNKRKKFVHLENYTSENKFEETHWPKRHKRGPFITTSAVAWQIPLGCREGEN